MKKLKGITRWRIRPSSHEIYFRPFLPAFLVFSALMVIIALSWRTAVQDVSTQRTQSVADKASFVRSTLTQRFSIYEDALRAATGVFAASDSVSRNEWSDFVSSLKLNERYPGISAVNFIKIVPAAELTAFVTNVRNEGYTTFDINPRGDRDTYASLLYVGLTRDEPPSESTIAALGFDMYSDPLRKIAMDTAMESGKPTLSRSLNLLESADQSPNGFLLFMPLYKKEMPINTKAERSAAIDGFFYAPFSPVNIFVNLFDINEPSFGFTIYDGVPDKSTKLYESSNQLSSNIFIDSGQDTIPLYGQTWNIIYKTSEEIVPVAIRSRPYSAVIGGTVFAFALATTLYLLIQRRTRSLAYAEQKKLDEAKDELLSLASHQLRTPATAVKQYVLMVKNGFAGKVSSEQRKLLQMAYESNERQLTIVDDLLYVARIDSGQASLKIERLDLSMLIKSVADDQKDILKSQQQSLQLSGVSKKVLIDGDPHYLRMVFENLLSNASKYSRENKKITISLKSSRSEVAITFKDYGVGIKEEDFHNVFKKFSRIPNELTRQTAGSGIGLYLAKQLAQLHSGDIEFTSSHQNGSTFVVRLPRTQPASEV